MCAEMHTRALDYNYTHMHTDTSVPFLTKDFAADFCIVWNTEYLPSQKAEALCNIGC